MSDFSVNVVKIDSVESHPDADRLSIVKIGGYNCISAKLEDGSHRYSANDLVVYIPEQVVLPEWMLKKMGFWKEEENKGTLSGSQGNRVKCVKLRGVISQGILYPTTKHDLLEKFCISTDLEGQRLLVNEGDNVTAFLEISKWEPPVPSHLSGEVSNAKSEYAFHYDIQNVQKYDRVLEEGELIVVTEKLHGSFCGLSYNPQDLDLPDEGFYSFSKGLGAKGLIFKNNENNQGNLYVQQLIKNKDNLKTLYAKFNTQVTVLSEVFGPVQDLKYGLTSPEIRVFDIYLGKPNQGRYLNDVELDNALVGTTLTRVPVLYKGPYSLCKITELRDGQTTINNVNQIERTNKYIGRVQLKFVSPQYLLRRGETSEYQ